MAKAEKKKRPRTQKGSLYKVEGETLTRLGRSCPKCGPGIFMANHKDGRYACGRCGYMER